MRITSLFLRITCLALALSLGLFAQAPPVGRAVPLNRAGFARSVATDSQGFFHIATVIGDDYFDGRDTATRVHRHLMIAQAAGARYLRCAFSWNGIEPAPGEYQFDFWDRLVEEASRADIKLMPYVAYTPKWAARSEQDFWKQPPKDPALYATLMRKLAERYRGRIRSWELWNEPDNNEYWTGSAGEFAAMVTGAAEAIRQADPAAVLVLGGISHGPAQFFNDLITNYHVDSTVDVLALHAYPESWHEERAEAIFQHWMPQMYSVAKRRGVDLWLNEMGYADYRYQPNHASVWGTDVYYRYEHTRRYEAEFLFKSFAMAAATGELSVAGWYRVDDFRHDDPRMPSDKVHYHLGLTDSSGKNKPAFFAFRFFNQLFSQPLKVIDQTAAIHGAPASQAVVHMFRRRDNTVVVTGWLRSSEYSEVKVHDGKQKDRRRERVTIDLPCTAADITTYNVLGKRKSHSHPYSDALTNVPLTGDRVYVAEVTCTRAPDQARKSATAARPDRSSAP